MSENAGQFQAGQSGNPGGRSRKEKLYRDALLLAIKRVHEADPKKRQKLHIIAEKHVEAAIEGKQDAINALADRLDGKVPQALIGSDDPDDAPLTVQHVQLVPIVPKPEGGQ